MRKTSFPEGGERMLSRFGLTRDQVTAVSFQPGEMIFEQGYPVPYFLLVVTGKVRIQTYSEDGRVLSFGFGVSNQSLGEMELLCEQENSTNDVIAVTRTVCLMLPIEQAKRIVRTNNTFLYTLAHQAALGWQTTQASAFSTLSTEGMTRLASFLLRQEEEGRILHSMTEIASAISVSYRHLLRMMKELCEEGILEKQGRRYDIKDRGKLESKAGY